MRTIVCFATVGFALLLGSLLSPAIAHAASPHKVCFQDHCLTVEIADTDVTRMRGLQERTSMNAGHGMLFVFANEDRYDFWMKDTLIPLDMIWLNGNRQVVDIKAHVPPCEKDPCPTYIPSGHAKYVLEVNAGTTQSYGLHVGDKAEFK
jgi:uncharacterized membrane protein (UPF0127 family)